MGADEPRHLAIAGQEGGFGVRRGPGWGEIGQGGSWLLQAWNWRWGLGDFKFLGDFWGGSGFMPPLSSGPALHGAILWLRGLEMGLRYLEGPCLPACDP